MISDHDKNTINNFFETLGDLSTGDAAVLRRNAGTMLHKADGQSLAVFYRCLPYSVPEYQESRWFAVSCLYCLLKGKQSTQKIESCFADMIRQHSSVEKRVFAILDLQWDEEGYFLMKFAAVIRFMVQMGYVFDCSSLLEDLLVWNSSNKYVQKKWTREMYGMPFKAKGE